MIFSFLVKLVVGRRIIIGDVYLFFYTFVYSRYSYLLSTRPSTVKLFFLCVDFCLLLYLLGPRKILNCIHVTLWLDFINISFLGKRELSKIKEGPRKSSQFILLSVHITLTMFVVSFPISLRSIF